MQQEFLPELIALQEHKLSKQEDIDEASAFLVRQGYSSHWGPAEMGPNKHPSAGVAVLISSRLGCKPVLVNAPRARVAAAKVQLQNDTEFIFISAYLHSGRGLKAVNLELLGAVAALQQKHQRYILAGGDWQNRPAAFSSTDFLFKGRLSIKSRKPPDLHNEKE